MIGGSLRHTLTRSCAVLVCAAGVPALTLILIHALYGVPLSAFRPVLNDEVAYWHQASTFAHAGFRGGYYTLAEATNPSGFTPFGPHGPGFAVLYGAFGAVFGWHRHSTVLLNLLVIAAAAWVWTALARASTARLLVGGLALVTFWHVLFWAPTGMQESLHHAGAIALAALFASALNGTASRAVTIAGWIMIGVLSFVRPSWVVVLPAWAWVASRRARPAVVVATVLGSIIVAALIVAAYSRTTAPFATGFFFLRALNLSSAWGAIVENVTFNLQRTVMLDEYQALEILHRVQYWCFFAAITALAAAAYRKRRTRSDDASPHLLVSAFVMSGALALMLLLYTLTNWAEHRVLSAFLLFGTMLCVAAPGRAPVALVLVLVVSNVFSANVFLASFADDHRDRFVWDRRGVYALEETLARRVAYRADRPRWCNTLLTSQYPPYMIAVPAGIGLSVVREPDQLHLPPRSRYLLLDEPARAAMEASLHLDAIASLPYGTLYRNLDAACQ